MRVALWQPSTDRTAIQRSAMSTTSPIFTPRMSAMIFSMLMMTRIRLVETSRSGPSCHTATCGGASRAKAQAIGQYVLGSEGFRRGRRGLSGLLARDAVAGAGGLIDVLKKAVIDLGLQQARD